MAELRQNEMVASFGSVVGNAEWIVGMVKSTDTLIVTRSSWKDWVKVLSGLSMIVIVAWIVRVTYLIVFEDNPPAEIFEIRPVKSEAAPGEYVSYYIDGCIYTDAQSEKSMTWEDSLSHIVPNPGNPPTQIGCVAVIETVEVPMSLPPGEDYYLKIVWIFPTSTSPLVLRPVFARVGPYTIVEKE